jgi:hypothetical protein
MPVQITTGVILATMAVLGLVITVVKATNKRFKETEDDLSNLRLTYTERAARTETELENIKTLQRSQGEKLTNVGENVAWLVKWARNGGTK